MTRIIFFAAVFFVSSSFAENTTYIDAPQKFAGPQAYKDPATGIIFYVESDGRHVSAISAKGKLLWTRNPFIDAGLDSYRFEFPVIVYLGKPNDWMIKNRDGKYIGIGFDSSQFGIMKFEDGDFEFIGQD